MAEDLLSKINSEETDEEREIRGTDYLAKFIEEYDYEMDIENIKYLIGISEKVAGIANNIRLNSIYKELSFDD